MFYWLNKTKIKEFLNLLLDLDFQLWSEISRCLLHRRSSHFNIELMGD